MKNLISLLFTLLIVVPAYSGEIRKWVDEDGKVHFGDIIPHQYRNQAESVQIKVNVIKSDIKYKKKEEPHPSLIPDVQRPIDNLSKSFKLKSSTPNKTSQCQRQWAAYNRSVDCFNKCSIPLKGGGSRGRNISRCKCVNRTRPSCTP